MSTSRWLTWTPPNSRIIEESLEPEPPKPPKPSFEGFAGATPGLFQKIEPHCRRVGGTALRRSRMSIAGPRSRIARVARASLCTEEILRAITSVKLA